LPSRSLAATEGPPTRRSAAPAGQPSLLLRCERRLEARGVEPLSFKQSTQPSTCLGGLCARGGAANRHATHPQAATKSIHPPPRPPRRKISLLSSHPGLAGVCRDTSRLLRPRERDLRNLHLFCLIRFFTRPTNHPRHAGQVSYFKSKPVRPQCS